MVPIATQRSQDRKTTSIVTLESESQPSVANSLPDVSKDMLKGFLDIGIGLDKANELLSKLPEEYIRKAFIYLGWYSEYKKEIKNISGFFLQAIQKNYINTDRKFQDSLKENFATFLLI